MTDQPVPAACSGSDSPEPLPLTKRTDQGPWVDSIPAASQTISNAPISPQNTQQPGQGQNPPQHAAEPQTGGGNVLPASQPPRRIETYRPVVQTVRNADGRFGSPRDPQPSEQRKAQSVAPTESPKSVADNELERRDTRIGGISDIPDGWPELPNNASLGIEVSWVQGERLRVVKETPRGGFKVDLSKAKTPAPSMGALAWLETAIRTPTKFAELAAKQGSSGSDEAEFIRKERMAIGEMRALLEEMRPKPRS